MQTDKHHCPKSGNIPQNNLIFVTALWSPHKIWPTQKDLVGAKVSYRGMP